jgi:hypothetical protein
MKRLLLRLKVDQSVLKMEKISLRRNWKIGVSQIEKFKLFDFACKLLNFWIFRNFSKVLINICCRNVNWHDKMR